MVAKAKYIPIHDEISMSRAIIQASSALDIAAQIAIASRDAGSLIQIAAVWLEVGNSLVTTVDDEDEEEDLTSETEITHSVGFGAQIGEKNGRTN